MQTEKALTKNSKAGRSLCAQLKSVLGLANKILLRCRLVFKKTSKIHLAFQSYLSNMHCKYLLF